MTIVFARMYTCSMTFSKINPGRNMDVHHKMVVSQPILSDFLDLVGSRSSNIISGTRISWSKMV